MIYQSLIKGPVCTEWWITDNLAEWLRRETRNLMGFPAQVQILQLSNLFRSADFIILLKYILSKI